MVLLAHGAEVVPPHGVMPLMLFAPQGGPTVVGTTHCVEPLQVAAVAFVMSTVHPPYVVTAVVTMIVALGDAHPIHRPGEGALVVMHVPFATELSGGVGGAGGGGATRHWPVVKDCSCAHWNTMGMSAAGGGDAKTPSSHKASAPDSGSSLLSCCIVMYRAMAGHGMDKPPGGMAEKTVPH